MTQPPVVRTLTPVSSLSLPASLRTLTPVTSTKVSPRQVTVMPSSSSGPRPGVSLLSPPRSLQSRFPPASSSAAPAFALALRCELPYGLVGRLAVLPDLGDAVLVVGAGRELGGVR